VSAHLDTDALADVLAGLGQPEHLDGCADCQAALADLSTAMTAVTSALAQLPDPIVPDDLSARLDAAIAAERRGDAPVPPARSTTVTPLDVGRPGLPRWTKAAGGLAVAAGLVVGLVLVTHGSSASKSTSAESAPAIARNDTGRAYTKDPTTLTSGLKALLKGNAPKQVAPAAGAAPLNPSTQKSAGADSFSSVDALAPLRGKDALAACLASLSDPNDPGIPLALDYGTFEGAPALLVILPSAKAGTVLAFFVGPECGAADSHLLYYEKVTAP
jgi:hypothetical protein